MIRRAPPRGGGREMNRTVAGIVCALVCAAASGCAARPNGAANDPLEPLNRKIFWFNDKADVYAIEPVARGWNFVMPLPVQHSVENFFDNLDFPSLFVNDVLQGKPRAAAIEMSRFILNTTIGIGGLFDPAGWWGVKGTVEDFGQTLGRWGIPGGPYLVLPILGPSNPRDSVGLAADAQMRVYPYFVSFFVTSAATVVRTVNLRSLFLKEVKSGKESALDYYVFVRDAYEQRRRALINDTSEVTDEEQDLYDVENE
jgi:phospholipid-binding lipoprotein MlaA